MADAVRIDGALVLKENVTERDRRYKINRILIILGKFAVDSAVKEFLKADAGGKKVHEIVQEGFMHQRPTPCLNDKKPEELKFVMEEDMNKVEQGNKILANSVNASEDSELPKKIPNEGKKESDILKTDKKRVFIRSRL